jgi:hypothetical protein
LENLLREECTTDKTQRAGILSSGVSALNYFKTE